MRGFYCVGLAFFFCLLPKCPFPSQRIELGEWTIPGQKNGLITRKITQALSLPQHLFLPFVFPLFLSTKSDSVAQEGLKLRLALS